MVFCKTKTRSPLIGGQPKRRAAKIRPKAVGGGSFGRSSNFEKCRPGVADVLYTMSAWMSRLNLVILC